MAPVIHELKKYPNDFDSKVCVTGQHREMLDQVLSIFNITPDFDLRIMKSNQSLFEITANVLMALGSILENLQPDIVLVHGDTTTTLAASLAAFYKKIPVGHVEAGLRTHNIDSPWPEEMNRQMTDRLCKYFFVPTQTGRRNLIKENIKRNILVTGNTVIDALYLVIDKISKDETLQKKLRKIISKQGYDMNEIRKKIILVTGHRRENFGYGFLDICNALKELALNNANVDIVYPVHLNPNVRTPVTSILSGISNIYLIEPLEYDAFVYLMSKAYIILTDSGGVQEEAPSLGKPVLVMRNTTERPEAVKAGTVKLVGTNKAAIVNEINTLLNNPELYGMMSKAHNPYGDGFASKRIVEYLKDSC